MSFGVNKASDRKLIKVILTTAGLVGYFAAVVGERRNSEVTKAVKALGFEEFLVATSDVLRSQTSGTRGRPALEEKPIHTMLKGMREAAKLRDGENINEEKATKVLAKALKVAVAEEENLRTRRALFKPSKRIQGAKRLSGIVNPGENAKA